MADFIMPEDLKLKLKTPSADAQHVAEQLGAAIIGGAQATVDTYAKVAGMLSDRILFGIAGHLYVTDMNLTMKEACEASFELIDQFDVTLKEWIARKNAANEAAAES